MKVRTYLYIAGTALEKRFVMHIECGNSNGCQQLSCGVAVVAD